MSVCIERITQMSSMREPMRGKISLTSMPLCPCRSNRNGDRIRLPVLRSVRRLPPGKRLAVILVEHRLGVEGIDLRHAAIHEQKDHALGLGRKVRGLWRERRGRLCRPAGWPKPSMPKPLPIRRSASRRLKGGETVRMLHQVSIQKTEFVRAQQHLRITAARRGHRHLVPPRARNANHALFVAGSEHRAHRAADSAVDAR